MGLAPDGWFLKNRDVMPTQDPLVVLRSCYHKPYGLVPPELLVQASADAGYRVAALADKNTLAGVPAFLEACSKRSVHPLVGMTVAVSIGSESGKKEPEDVLSLGEASHGQRRRQDGEEVVLVAENRTGFLNLLRQRALVERSRDGILTQKQLLEASEGLFLLTGSPGSLLRDAIAGHQRLSAVADLEEFLTKWPRQQMAFGGLYSADRKAVVARRFERLKKLPMKIPPIAVTFAAYRNQNERVWGFAAHLSNSGEEAPFSISSSLILENGESVNRSFQGLSRTLRAVAKLASRESDLRESLRCSVPVYPCPRGTDVASLFWTLGQEAAISTGHIRRPDGKERLYEEFQYFKQTPWPNVFLILWDVRRRSGLPPGTLRPTGEWVCSSLFAHLLGFTRVDPLRENIPFNPMSLHVSESEGLQVEVEAPMGWDREIFEAAEGLFGAGHVKNASGFEPPKLDSILSHGYRLLNSWEELEFPGDRPAEVPPPPSYLKGESGEGPRREQALLSSGTNLENVFAARLHDRSFIEARIEDAVSLGALCFEVTATGSQTLAAAPRYRGIADEEEGSPAGHESLTEWIESHEGKLFHGKAYADDTGRFDLLARTSCLLRLFSLPGSSGYRPLLWWWILLTAPKRLGELADLLTLSWHWTFWSQRPARRAVATARRHPLAAGGSTPPWWTEWEEFRGSCSLSSKLSGKLGSELEKHAARTGGWLLYADQLDGALDGAFGMAPEERDRWLSPGTADSAPKGGGDSGLWDRRTRTAFLQFLGNPNPLPSRVSSLAKAERFLAAATSFSEDPAAVVAMVSFLYPNEDRERREVYSLVQEMGVRLMAPRLPEASAFDTSPAKDCLRIGLLNVLGVGPNNVWDLTDPSHPADEHQAARLFETQSPLPRLSWGDWLRQHAKHPIGSQILSGLIRLGLCDGFGKSRRQLVEEARSHLRRQSSGTHALQQTLFPLGFEGSSGSSEADMAWEAAASESTPPAETEWKCLRFGISGTPLERLRGVVPERWFQTDPLVLGVGSRAYVLGWVQEIDLFASPSHGGAELSPENVWMSFLLFNGLRSFRLVDPEGRLRSQLPVPLPEEPRVDGHRIHLKSPWILLCQVRKNPQPDPCCIPVLGIEAAETLTDLFDRKLGWTEISVHLTEASNALRNEIESLCDWFGCADGEWCIPLSTVPSGKASGSRSVRRLVRRLGTRSVFASTLLVETLQSLPGVDRVSVLTHQAPLFPAE